MTTLLPEIIEVDTAHEEYRQAINNLLPELASTPHPMSAEEWKTFASDPSHRLFLLRIGPHYAGMLTLGYYTAPTGRKCMIEDVVVSQTYRGKGLGRMLLRHAIAEVSQQAPISLMLTSRPSRIAANALYRSEGFAQKETNVYVMKFE